MVKNSLLNSRSKQNVEEKTKLCKSVDINMSLEGHTLYILPGYLSQFLPSPFIAPKSLLDSKSDFELGILKAVIFYLNFFQNSDSLSLYVDIDRYK